MTEQTHSMIEIIIIGLVVIAAAIWIVCRATDPFLC